jgi:hypothetical protein
MIPRKGWKGYDDDVYECFPLGGEMIQRHFGVNDR